MSCRLEGFDYTKPLFYMVTLKKRAGLTDFSSLAPPGSPPPRDATGRECWLLPSRVTRAFSAVIRGFSQKWRCLAPVKHFVVMPDHLHLLLKIEPVPNPVPLANRISNIADYFPRENGYLLESTDEDRIRAALIEALENGKIEHRTSDTFDYRGYVSEFGRFLEELSS